MNLTIDTRVINEVLLENDELFKSFLTNYYDFEDKVLNEKYRLTQTVLQIYEDLEKKNIYEFNEQEYTKNFKKRKILKKQSYSYYNFYLQERVLKKLKLNNNYNLKPVSINKVKIKKINKNCVTKNYTFYHDNKDNYAYFMILNEIIIHYYAYLLMQDYKSIDKFRFKVPKLYKIEKKRTKSGNIKISLYMEYMYHLDKTKINNIFGYQEKIHNILNYLERNFLFHNDTHNDNILFQKNNIVIIDFGQASMFEKNNLSDYSFKYETKNKCVFDNWLNKKKTIFY